ncbi:MAG: hypothetical protein ACTSVB_03400 [Candidatus Heimdallarchaeaceae archaeon]
MSRKIVLYDDKTGEKIAINIDDIKQIKEIKTFLLCFEKDIRQLYEFHNRFVNRLSIDVCEAEKEYQGFEENIFSTLDINLQNVNKLSENLTMEVSYEFID